MDEVLGALHAIGCEAAWQGGATAVAALVALAAWRVAKLADERARWANDTADYAMLQATGNCRQIAALQTRLRSLEEASRRRGERERARTSVRVARGA
jgi:hypothetical protein